jgi:hypothetical protein
MSESENEEGAAEEAPAEEGVEPMPEVVPEDYLDQREYDPSGRPL